ncbi:MFS transporter [Leucobacter luti]|uniref:AAHS family benzoate transporter-like MFS transporter n=1 Tax=Leucobacter luti TaxID=340320 RepID=A0A4Q7TY27_9MICO|nr:aromatic acid/H+ symport family MFS transporter [Leucobacter luti]MBL3698701.1 MFS transporter [Leucobacter luti]RZT66075.1 AAHS family benzoate transporter-like MFS transporter [Leucobacter luti]
MSSTTSTDWHVPARVTRTVVVWCWAAILAEGYDVGVIGAVLPAIADDRAWNLDPVALGGLAAWALVGMLVGALFVGTLSDRLGRKRMLLISLATFTSMQLGAALSPTPEFFGFFRFLGGLGMGGIIPVAAALTIEYSPPRRRALNYGIMYSGYSLGIVVSALVAMILLPLVGWRWVIAVGAVPFLMLPLVARYLPESLESLENTGRTDAARALAARLGIAPYVPREPSSDDATPQTPWRQIIRQLFSRAALRSTVFLWISLFAGMLLVYGLNSWLPSIMRESGYDLGPALAFLLVFSLSSAAGGLVLGWLADRFGAKSVLIVFYTLGGLASLLMMFPNAMVFNLVLVGISGVGSISASLVLTAYITDYYPPAVRATATGWALSFARIGAIIGPVLGGWIAALGIGVEWNFITFASVAIIAAIAVALVPRKPAAISATVTSAVQAPR